MQVWSSGRLRVWQEWAQIDRRIWPESAGPIREWFCPKLASIGVHEDWQPNRNAEGVRTVPQRQAPEHRHLEVIKVLSKDIENGELAF